jgi:CheY-like chemotaxis protein
MARILVVDDESGIRDFLVDTLAEAGHDVDQAADARAAMDRLEDQPYDLVLLDLNMPGDQGGLEVLRRARAEWPEMQAIVLTAHGTVETAVEAMRLGAFDFLEKPVEGPEAVRRLARRALNWRGTPAAQRRDPGGEAHAARGTEAAAPNGRPAGDQPPANASRLHRFLWEAKRRHVYNVAVSYAAVGFIVLQGAQLVLPVLPLPDWSYRALVVLTIAGFPIAVVLGWVYDLSAAGIRRSGASAAPPEPSTMAGQTKE